MYYVHTIRDTLSVPPAYFGVDLNDAAAQVLRNKYERVIDKDLGVVIAVFNVRDISDGTILPGDPNTHHDVTFDVLSFTLEVEEVVVGEVSELVEFGSFVRIGPLDGLVHLSQVTSDFINFDRKTGVFTSRNTGKTLKKGDTVYAKVSTISIKNSVKDSKIALTMRPEGLGKPEWIIEKPREKREGKQGRGRGRR
ncbi:MAG: DNA-directed RNA polymerase [Candidatus Micrarchaeota archaeon]|nr:DNA-directed RNA polymerase [Candidatus Micrarchaeota archaeon]MDE1847535.1 DNA-directed RNA polymerase [Candidatus Micrarchaeota archaeon]MDE1864252.1 DNA-directed RNA polymerase [Candidatus Micrarchaeota archaeon]